MHTAVHYPSQQVSFRAGTEKLRSVATPEARGRFVKQPPAAPASDKDELAVLERQGLSDEVVWARLGNWDL